MYVLIKTKDTYLAIVFFVDIYTCEPIFLKKLHPCQIFDISGVTILVVNIAQTGVFFNSEYSCFFFSHCAMYSW